MSGQELSEETIKTIEALVEMLQDCFNTKEEQKLRLDLAGSEMGDSITITMKYKGNKNANKSLN